MSSPARPTHLPVRIGVLTSGGDAPGMNAAVRAVVRAGLRLGAQMFLIHEGYQGLVDGGDGITPADWDSVGSILHRGGTIIGTYRSKDFRTRPGQLKAATNLLRHGIDRLVVIGGDGSLTGANAFREAWPDLLAEVREAGEVDPELIDRHPDLIIAGLVGSIDNDLVGTDQTIGADSALHRIVDALDDISSTAASHQRSFVVEVMGRHCGYLALMSAIAGTCDFSLIPEQPPPDGWEERMCAELRRGRAAGRRESMVIVAEGATDRAGNPITAEYVKDQIAERLGEDTRVTILGHVQRGGSPSAYDRWMSTWLGYVAVKTVFEAAPGTPSVVIGNRGNTIIEIPLMEAVAATRQVPALIDQGDYDRAVELRGSSFAHMHRIFRAMSEPPRVRADADAKRIAIVHAGGLAPGMNTAAHAAVRLGIEEGFQMVGAVGGFPGLADGNVRPLDWGDVEGWAGLGGAELGTRRRVPEIEHLYAIGRVLENERIDGLLVIGGWNAYLAANLLWRERDRYPAFRIPMVCVPASIDNNLPGSELSIGSDTALNEISDALDRIKQSASASRRCFVVETMGRHCGYLTLMGGLAGGAERVYLHEDGVTLADLGRDVELLNHGFAHGRRLFLAIRNEEANPLYTTDFMARVFEEEGGDLFDVRQAILGHLQQGGNPSPSDRLLATQLVDFGIDTLKAQLEAGGDAACSVGTLAGQLVATPMERMFDDADTVFRRPRRQWWLELRAVLQAVAEEPR
ncbi:6-phosphofructokinase [Granulicoccus phenolivorans]|uniref:6-phosphofructokinase n=1 Tax=Granulicoccus phenolivorans TaxID=266854 RepID=UPI0004036055|nr:6-phosphofructokinase [Granulicoccus phenolivorans]